jgi:hypothetical protein
MTELVRKILKERLDMESHNLMCYSKNLLMEEPKDQYVKEHAETLALIRAIEKELNTK